MKNSLICGLFLLCHGMSLGGASSASGQLLVAHRGASHDAPENTLAAFRLAWEQGADAIEGDCYLTVDGKIVFIHDQTTERVSGVKLLVKSSTLADLQRLDVGSWKDKKFTNERMPTLPQVLESIPDGKQIYIEVRCGPEIIPQLTSDIAQSRLKNDQIVIISFSRDVVAAAKQAMPKIKAYWLFSFKQDKKTEEWYPSTKSVIATAKQINADGVDLKAVMEQIDEEFVTRCHAAGLSLHAWTVDNPNVANRLRELGFASITTNRPAFLRRAMATQSVKAASTLTKPPTAITEAPGTASRATSALGADTD